MARPESLPLRVGVIGHGAIGSVIVRLLLSAQITGCELAGVLTRSQDCVGRVDNIDQLLEGSDLVVEAAGHSALDAYGISVVRRGIDLLVLSVGALVADQLRTTLLETKGGRVLISTGAVGGLDLLRAAAQMGPLDSVSLESIKPAKVLIQDWMSSNLIDELRTAEAPVEAFSGSAREAAIRFPASANVAATLGLATIGLDRTQVTLIGMPNVDQVRHTIRASGAAGSYEFSIENRASAENPRTSAVTPYSVVRALNDMRSPLLVGI
jgi:aspartate dehydrogenase